MAHKQALKEILREYEMDRLLAKRELDRRKSELYEKIPRLEEIDSRLTKLGITLSKIILSEGGNSETFFEFRENIKILKEEKLEILNENGYNESYFENIYKCMECKDTGYVGNKKCKCLTQKLVERYYNISNVNKIIEKENFDMFDFRYYSEEVDSKTGVSPLSNMQNIYSSCMSFITNFDKIINGNLENLLFYGETGLGKTFLCNCIAKDILDKGKTVLYVTAPQIFKKIEDFRFGREMIDTPNEQINMIFLVDLLIIDDLGSEFPTMVTSTELFNIINTRILESKPTIISTNFSLGEFQDNYSDRIVSRLFGNYKMMHFFGDDIRVKKKHNKFLV